jgi:transposase
VAKYQEWIETDGLLKIEGWARDGLTNEQIAKKIGVSTETLYTWKNKYSEISDALKKGKEVIDRQVENALLKRALGYEYTETKIEEEFGEITKKTVTVKQVAPDVTAQIFWLKNRKREEWRDKQHVEVSNLAEEQSKLSELLEQRRKRRDEK